MKDLRLELSRAIRFVDGAPDVTGLPCDAIAAGGEGDYMRRYYLKHERNESIRFHHILGSDPGRVLHDHPWDFVSVMLTGSYTEITPDGPVTYDAPCLITRKAEQLHRLVLTEPAWTYVVCGRVRRKWGFDTEHGWTPWDRYPDLGTLGICEEPGRSF